jgi:hypothetical protein
MNFLKRLWYRLTGRSIQVSFLALPSRDLTIELLYQIGKDGEWKVFYVSMASLLVSGKTPVETVMDCLDSTGYVYHIKLLKKAPKSVLNLLNNKTQTQEYM